MTGYIFEQDLRGMKYAILVSPRHDRTVNEIAEDLGLGVQALRKYLIARLDMILLENLPARYEAGLLRGDPDDPVAKALGRSLFTKYVPLVDSEDMERVYEWVRNAIDLGMPAGDAVSRGKDRIRSEMMP
jgi:energy-converting hydrogenase A subunit M